MNYYEHHIGDYAAATSHLSWDEDMAYTRLLRAYYHHERGIPVGQQYRLARASTAAQRKAVDAVLEEFFTLMDGLHTQKRADSEILKFNEKQPERVAKKVNDRERQRRSRERRAKLFEELRRHDVVPAFDTPLAELELLLSRVTTRDASPDVTRDMSHPVTRDNTGTQHQHHTQTPNPENQGERANGIPRPVVRALASHDPGKPSTQAAIAAKAMRQAGLPDAHPGHQGLKALLEAGVTVDELQCAAADAVRGGKGFAWALKAAENRRRDAANVASLPQKSAPKMPWENAL